jgi:hypothetical protein
LFGEGSTKKSYAILCLSEDETHISSVFEDAAKDGTSPADFRVLDCNYVLPTSEKTIADRFKLNLKQRPTVFVSGHTGPPKQVRMMFDKRLAHALLDFGMTVASQFFFAYRFPQNT